MGGITTNTPEQDARQTIIDTTKALIEEADDTEKITIRQIAERAGVGTGLINYHFKSKNNLISIAIGDVMVNTILNFTNSDAYSHLDPIAKLKTLVKALCALIGDSEKLVRFLLHRELVEGSMQAPLYLVPLLREIFGNQKEDMQLRIIALQIIQPIQSAGLNPRAFHMYSGIDLQSAEQRNRFIDTLIDNAINPYQGKEEAK